jgi:hypothetical protein
MSKFYTRSFYTSPVKVIELPATDPEREYGFMRSLANMVELKRRDIEAYERFSKRLAKETWQVVDVDVVRELERLDELETADEISVMRGYLY